MSNLQGYTENDMILREAGFILAPHQGFWIDKKLNLTIPESAAKHMTANNLIEKIKELRETVL